MKMVAAIVNLILFVILYGTLCFGSDYGIEFVQHPRSVSSSGGGKVILSCVANINPSRFIWKHNFTTEVIESDFFHVWTSHTEPYTTTLTVTVPQTVYTEKDLVGTYQCIADLEFIALMSDPAVLSVRSQGPFPDLRRKYLSSLLYASKLTLPEGTEDPVTLFEFDPAELHHTNLVTAYLMKNGKKVKQSLVYGGQKEFSLDHVQLEDAGLYQVFLLDQASGFFAEAATLVHVLPKQKAAAVEEIDDFKSDRSPSVQQTLPKPSAPSVTRLSDSSVMLHWTLADTSNSTPGLSVFFQRVQYKEAKRKSSWETVDEEILPHISSYAVSGLEAGKRYKFRIAVVFSNNDNTHGSSSNKFTLSEDDGTSLSLAPDLVELKSLSTTAIELEWSYQLDQAPIEGFYIHYRPTTEAREYDKTTVLGSTTRNHVLSPLIPSTTYDIKIQAFNLNGVSPFSPLKTARTQGYQAPDEISTPKPVMGNRQRGPSLLHSDLPLAALLGIVISTVVLLLLFLLIFKRLWNRHLKKSASSSATSEEPQELEATSICRKSSRDQDTAFPASMNQEEALLGRFSARNSLYDCQLCSLDDSSELGIPVVCRHQQQQPPPVTSAAMNPTAFQRTPVFANNRFRLVTDI